MLETSARLLKLLGLLQAKRYWPGAMLAERLEVTGRTLRRDVDRLRALGYQINSAAGTGGGYQLAAADTVPPLLLDDEESVAVAIGLRTAASGSVGGMEEASLRALGKLEQMLPSRLSRRVNALTSSIVAVPGAGPVVDAALLSAMAASCRESRVVEFFYQGREAEAAPRRVEPHRLVHVDRRWYLVGWDRARSDWRTFRMDRIDGGITTAEFFTPRELPDPDIARYVLRGVAYSQYAKRCKVMLHAPIALAAERIPPTAGLLEAAGDDRCLLHAGSSFTLDVVAVHVAALGFEFEVCEPPELAEHIRSLSERLARAASRVSRL